MKAVVIYRSKTGFTKKYAEWIAEDLACDIFEVSRASSNMLSQYDTIIFGGSLHAVGINGVKFIKENLNKLKDKKVVVFATGATPPREEDISKVWDSNFTAEQQKYIKVFYMRGGFDYNKLNLIDKLLMTLLKLKIKSKNKKVRTPDEKGMLATYNKPVDFTRKKNIEELINYVKS